MAQKPTKPKVITKVRAKGKAKAKTQGASKLRQRAVQERAEITIEKLCGAATRLNPYLASNNNKKQKQQ